VAKDLLIEALEVQKLEIKSVFDGVEEGRMAKIMPVNRIVTSADLNELIAGLDYKPWERKLNESPSRPVEKITLVCMWLLAHARFEFHSTPTYSS
jgi:site-specific DNA-methyltransferase (adenine-specific)/adenine-specific DNA-methyltransferase